MYRLALYYILYNNTNTFTLITYTNMHLQMSTFDLTSSRNCLHVPHGAMKLALSGCFSEKSLKTSKALYLLEGDIALSNMLKEQLTTTVNNLIYTNAQYM